MAEQKYNQLNEVPLANLDENALKQIKEFEHQLNDKYVLIAFEK